MRTAPRTAGGQDSIIDSRLESMRHRGEKLMAYEQPLEALAKTPDPRKL